MKKWSLFIQDKKDVFFKKQVRKPFVLFGRTIIKGKFKKSWSPIEDCELIKMRLTVENCIKEGKHLQLVFDDWEEPINVFIHKKHLKEFRSELTIVERFLAKEFNLSDGDLMLLNMLFERNLI